MNMNCSNQAEHVGNVYGNKIAAEYANNIDIKVALQSV